MAAFIYKNFVLVVVNIYSMYKFVGLYHKKDSVI